MGGELQCLERLQDDLAVFLEIRPVRATEKLNEPIGNAINERHAPPAPELLVQLRKIGIPRRSMRTVNEGLCHGWLPIAGRFEENGVCAVVFGLFHDGHFLGSATILHAAANRHKAIDGGAATGTAEVRQPLFRIAHAWNWSGAVVQQGAWTWQGNQTPSCFDERKIKRKRKKRGKPVF